MLAMKKLFVILIIVFTGINLKLLAQNSNVTSTVVTKKSSNNWTLTPT